MYVADAVFESVAQVLLSRSRGLTSRFQQLISKTDAEVTNSFSELVVFMIMILSWQQGGSEELAMKMQLERLFIQGEQERVRQENIEKQQAEQVAASECM